MKAIRALTILILLIFLLPSCGMKVTPRTSSASEALPNGTLVADGTFTGSNGKTVTGIASVFFR